jgi:hypothetical protein
MADHAQGFEDFLARNQVDSRTVDSFAGFAVDVALPMDWVPVDASEIAQGARAWVWRNDPRRTVFGANAVLVLQHFDKALDPQTVFAGICGRQRHAVPAGSHEQHRDLGPSGDGPGYAGTLVLNIAHPVGTIDSVTYSRIVADDAQTLVAQLTVTALDDSPLERGQVRLSMAADHAPAAADTVSYHGGQPSAPAAGP